MTGDAFDLTLVNFDTPSEVREFPMGRFELYEVGPITLGRATRRDFFYVPPGHDIWVVGDEPYVSLHIMGSESYAR